MNTTINTTVSPLTENTFHAAKAQGGWRTNCCRSPIAKGEPMLVADGDGWERARERSPRAGYEYALKHTSTRPGFARQAERQYWSLVRRPLSGGCHMTMTTYKIAPATDPADFYAAGFNSNDFETEEEASEAIPGLRACGEDFDHEWVVVEVVDD